MSHDRALPMNLRVMGAIFLALPLWSLSFAAPPWALARQVPAAAATASLLAFWVLPLALVASLWARSIAVIGIYLCECLAIAAVVMIEAASAGSTAMVLRLAGLGLMAMLGAFIGTRDGLYPFLSKAKRGFRRSPRLAANRKVRIADASGRDAMVMLENASLNGLGIFGAQTDLQPMFATKAAGSPSTVFVPTSSTEEIEVAAALVWTEVEGQSLRCGFSVTDTRAMGAILASLDARAGVRGPAALANKLWASSSLRVAALALWATSVALTTGVPACGSRDAHVDRSSLRSAALPAGADIVGVVLETAEKSLVVGTEARLDDFALDQRGAKYVTDGIAIESDAPAVVSIVRDASGYLLKAASPGKASIRGTFGTVSATLEVEARVAKIARLDVAPVRRAVAGSNVALRAFGTFDDGKRQDLSTSVAWQSGDAAVLRPLADAAANVFQAATAGSTQVTAKFGALGAVGGVTVVAAEVRALNVFATSRELPVGTFATVELTTVFGDFSQATTDSGVEVVVANPTIVGVVPEGPGVYKVVAIAPGKTDVRFDGAGRSASVSFEVRADRPVALAASQPLAELIVGQKTRLSATATLDSGKTLDVTEGVLWQTANADVATVENGPGSAGSVRANAPGKVELTATSSYGKAVVAVTVVEAALERITISPPLATLAAGLETDFSARGYRAGGESFLLTDEIVWSVVDGNVASISNLEGEAGRLRGLRTGKSSVQASYRDLRAEAALEVTAAAVAGVALDRETLTLPTGGSDALRLFATDTTGKVTEVTRQATWTSSDAQRVSVGNGDATAGVLRAGETGVATISASLGERVARALVQIEAPALVSIDVSAIDPLPVGEHAALAARARYADGSGFDVTVECQWTSDNEAVARVSDVPDSKGEVSSVGAGIATIAASCRGRRGERRVTVTEATLVKLDLVAADDNVPVGASSNFRVFGSYSDASRFDLSSSATWSVEPAATAVVESGGPNGGRVTGVAAGSATVQAERGGKRATARVIVTDATLVSIAIDQVGRVVPAGSTIPFTVRALYSDFITLPVTGAGLLLTSSNTTVADFSTPGRLAAIKPGTVTISASYQGKTATTLFSVTAAELTGIVVQRADGSADPLYVGTSRPFTAIASYSDGSTLDITSACIWSTDQESVARAHNGPGEQGNVDALDAGTTLLKATTTDNRTAELEVTVEPAAWASLAIDPTPVSTFAGTVKQLQANATKTDGKLEPVTESTRWTSSSDGFSVSNSSPRGLLKVLDAGVASGTITAEFAGLSATAPVTVAAATLQALTITPSSKSLVAGGSLATAQLSVSGTYDNGVPDSDMTPFVTFVTLNPSVAQVSNDSATKGLVSAVGSGDTVIEARLPGSSVKGFATISVTTPPNNPPTLEDPGDKQVFVGSMLTFDLVASDPDPNTALVFTCPNCPPNLTLSANGRVAWQPSVAAEYPGVIFRVTDNPGNAMAEQIVNLVASTIDTVPDDFSFAGKSVANEAVATSDKVTLSGFTPPQPLTLSGAVAGAAFTVDGSTWKAWAPGDQITASTTNFAVQAYAPYYNGQVATLNVQVGTGTPVSFRVTAAGTDPCRGPNTVSGFSTTGTALAIPTSSTAVWCVKLWGGGGGSGSTTGRGGGGGFTRILLDTSKMKSVSILVAKAGAASVATSSVKCSGIASASYGGGSVNAFNGAFSALAQSGGGGGRSYVTGLSKTGLTLQLAEAGGGGGGSLTAGGAGGGDDGAAGIANGTTPTAAQGGSATAGGKGGRGTISGTTYSGNDGSTPSGGQGAKNICSGGGGGGHRGGGGGGPWAGGGGGSGFVPLNAGIVSSPYLEAGSGGEPGAASDPDLPAAFARGGNNGAGGDGLVVIRY